MLLVGDIGGTNTRLALFNNDASEILREEVYPSTEYPSLSAAIDVFLGPKTVTRPRLRAATFGIAGPVVDGRVRTTNLPWLVDSRALARQLGLKKVSLVNDLVALALGAVAAKKKELVLLQGARAPKPTGGSIVVLAAGTGLGEAALVWDGERLVPCGTEGGHADFAPRSALEWELHEFIAKRVGGHVSYERVLSGPGIGTIYDFLVEVRGVRENAAAARQLASAKDRNATITQLGTVKASKACTQALTFFASIYGAEAGNLALKYLAIGGVFLAGKIAASILPALEASFVPAFVDKGRFRPLLTKIPVAVVKSSSIEDRASKRGLSRKGVARRLHIAPYGRRGACRPFLLDGRTVVR